MMDASTACDASWKIVSRPISASAPGPLGAIVECAANPAGPALVV
jgi:hypothetical protein